MIQDIKTCNLESNIVEKIVEVYARLYIIFESRKLFKNGLQFH